MNLIDTILYESELYEKKLLKLLFHKVKSSNLDSVAYDGGSERLQIKFKGGGKYEYDDVPETVFKQLRRARSKGRFFWRNVRDEYPYLKLK